MKDESNRYWKTGIKCDDCGSDIYAYNTYVSAKKAYWGYMCKECKIGGQWTDFAKRRLRDKGY